MPLPSPALETRARFRLRPRSAWFAFILGTLGVLALVPLTSTAEAEAFRHLELRGSAPAADTVITGSPHEIRLFFSEPPVMSGTSVRLADAQEELVATSEALADEDDPREVYILPGESGLAPGEYTVHWRVIAQDGHAQRGTFGFTLRQE